MSLKILMVLKIHILGELVAVSRDDAFFSGERDFQAKVYFKSGRGICIQEKIILRLTSKFLVSVTG